MSKKNSNIFAVLSVILFVCTLTGCNGVPGILNPKGVVAFEERELMFNSAALMTIVVLSVIIMSLVFVYHYRATNHKAEYKPDWCHNNFLEAIWWGVPTLIIVILAIMTWIYTHKLDPYRKLSFHINGVAVEDMQVEVVALPYKWMFYYPEYDVATVNYLALPNNIQTEFFLTTDNVPMSSFFIPQLGSQIYTMAGMRTRLHLIPTYTGRIEGLNAQYNGDGFAHMRFNVDVMEPEDFKKWIATAKQSKLKLDETEYKKIRQPSDNEKAIIYSSGSKGLFNKIIKSYNAAKHPDWSDATDSNGDVKNVR